MLRSKEQHRKEERERYRRKHNVIKTAPTKEDKENYEKENGVGSWKKFITKSWAEKNKENARKNRQLVINEYGGKCVCCGESEPKFLALDHINNDGAEHRRSIFTGRYKGGNIVNWIIKNNYPKDILQILCHNCNMSKGHWGYCPHKESVL